MNVAELREQIGLSQSAFARRFGIPVRTLQQWEQKKSTPPQYVISMIERLLKSEETASEAPAISARHQILPKTRWRVCIDEPFKNCERIYPIQQRKVKELVDDLARNPDVQQVKIFGSSVTERCHMGSDVDVYVETKDPQARASQLLSRQYDFPFDLWTDSMLDKRLEDEIARTGVVVYG